MKFQFKQAVSLNGKTFARGFHYVPQKIQDHKFFKKLLKVDLVIPVANKPALKEQDVVANLPEHQKKLVEQINKKLLQKASEEVGDPPSVESGSESGEVVMQPPSGSPPPTVPPSESEDKVDEKKKPAKKGK